MGNLWDIPGNIIRYSIHHVNDNNRWTNADGQVKDNLQNLVLLVEYDLIGDSEDSCGPHTQHQRLAEHAVCAAQVEPGRVAGGDEYVYGGSVAVVEEFAPVGAGHVVDEGEAVEEGGH